MRAYATERRDALVKLLSEAGHTPETFPVRWERVARDRVSLTLAVPTLTDKPLSSTKPLRLYAFAEDHMTVEERDTVEGKLFEALYTKFSQAIRAAERKRRREDADPSTSADVPSTSATPAPAAKANKVRDVLMVGCSAAGSVREKVLAPQRNLRAALRELEVSVGGAVGPEVAAVLEAVAQLDQSVASELLTLKRRRTTLTPTSHGPLILKINHVLSSIHKAQGQVHIQLDQETPTPGPRRAEVTALEAALARLEDKLLNRLLRPTAAGTLGEEELRPPRPSAASHSTTTVSSAAALPSTSATSAAPLPSASGAPLPSTSATSGDRLAASEVPLSTHSSTFEPPVVKRESGFEEDESQGAVLSDPPPASKREAGRGRTDAPRSAAPRSPEPCHSPVQPRPRVVAQLHPDSSEDGSCSSPPQRPSSNEAPPSPTSTPPPAHHLRCLFCAQPQELHHYMSHCKADDVIRLRSSVFGQTDPWDLSNVSRRFTYFEGIKVMRLSRKK